MPESSKAVTLLDIKAAVRESGNIKWQKRWDAGNTDRHLRRSVTAKSNPTADLQRIMTALN